MPPLEDESGPILRARASHLYPGATGSIDGILRPGRCLVEFADGAAALGELTPHEGGAILRLAGYSTARGTAIPPKVWRIGVEPGGAFRVTARG